MRPPIALYHPVTFLLTQEAVKLTVLLPCPWTPSPNVTPHAAPSWLLDLETLDLPVLR
jgi:hypothetical protein